jgi:glycosyltransferase involved in cell wall biosynthesis
MKVSVEALGNRCAIVQIVADGRPGGGTTAVLGLSCDLLDAGERVALITDEGSYAAQAAREAGVDVTEIPFSRSRLDPRVALGIGRALRRLRPALVHAHGARAGLPLSLLARGGEKRVYTVHGFHFLGKGGLARRLARLAEVRIARRSDCGIFVSESDARIAATNGIQFARSALIYNGISFDDLPPEPPEKRFDLVFCARLHRQKNPLFALDIMRILGPEGVRMLMVGGGELEQEVHAQARRDGIGGAISLVGALPRGEALAAMRSARLFLMPSLWEGLPIAPIEALASGVPVVASDIDGTREVVRDAQTGLLVKGFDAGEWASAIRSLLQDTARRVTMSQAGIADAEARFTRARVSSAHRQLYRELMEPAR